MLKRVFRWADVATCVVILGLAIAFRPHTRSWFIGIGLATANLPLWIAARLQLGSAFSIKARAQRLVTSGLYAKISHPIYLFGCLAVFGALLALQIWVILVIWLALTPFELVRIRRENQVLRATFGDDYERYRSTTWF